ncbi:hypothetical protein PR048_029383 [Dryococelus australis]|uniref:Core Histone H2A/H2B/H3 domain-containing protein n=1 Tax=Dryococelus australis TaxID=614101 RepID=A0ABQ9GDU8_9NEOP|nr:hypothetical protein PR048_029383 [Dryococelus australis]
MNQARFPAGAPGYSHVESCRTMPLVGGSSLDDLPFPPSFHSDAVPYSPHVSLIGSQDLDVRNRPNLLTHSPQTHHIARRGDGALVTHVIVALCLEGRGSFIQRGESARRSSSASRGDLETRTSQLSASRRGPVDKETVRYVVSSVASQNAVSSLRRGSEAVLSASKVTHPLKGRGERDIPEETRRPTASSGTNSHLRKSGDPALVGGERANRSATVAPVCVVLSIRGNAGPIVEGGGGTPSSPFSRPADRGVEVRPRPSVPQRQASNGGIDSGKTAKKAARLRKTSPRSTVRVRKAMPSYIYKVLKQVHPDTGTPSEAMSIMGSFADDIFERIAAEASRLAHYNERSTITSRVPGAHEYAVHRTLLRPSLRGQSSNGPPRRRAQRRSSELPSVTAEHVDHGLHLDSGGNCSESRVGTRPSLFAVRRRGNPQLRHLIGDGTMGAKRDASIDGSSDKPRRRRRSKVSPVSLPRFFTSDAQLHIPILTSVGGEWSGLYTTAVLSFGATHR